MSRLWQRRKTQTDRHCSNLYLIEVIGAASSGPNSLGKSPGTDPFGFFILTLLSKKIGGGVYDPSINFDGGVDLFG